jgi:DNA-binding IclR family transcriptional regulator
MTTTNQSRDTNNLSPERDVLVEMGERWWSIPALRRHLGLPERAALTESLQWLQEEGYVEDNDDPPQSRMYRRTGKTTFVR